MSMQRAQGVLLFLVHFNNSARFEIYRVTRSSSSRPFLCALDQDLVEFLGLAHTFVTMQPMQCEARPSRCALGSGFARLG